MGSALDAFTESVRGLGERLGALLVQLPPSLTVGATTTSVHVQIATMNKLAGIELLTVPYKGIPATITDVIGGTLDATLVDLANAMTQAKAGKLRPVAVTSLKRSDLVPDWPAVSETLPGFDFPSWIGLVGPAGMPPALVHEANSAVLKALEQREIQDRLASIGMTPTPLSADAFAAMIANDTSRWVDLARQANVQPQ